MSSPTSINTPRMTLSRAGLEPSCPNMNPGRRQAMPSPISHKLEETLTPSSLTTMMKNYDYLYHQAPRAILLSLLSFFVLCYSTICSLLHLPILNRNHSVSSIPTLLSTSSTHRPKLSPKLIGSPHAIISPSPIVKSSSSTRTAPSKPLVEQQLQDTEKAYRMHIISTRQALMALEEENSSLLHRLSAQDQLVHALQSDNAELRGSLEMLKHHFTKTVLSGFLDRLIWQNRVLTKTKEVEDLRWEKNELEQNRRKMLLRQGRKIAAESEKQAMLETFVQEMGEQHRKVMETAKNEFEERNREWKEKEKKLLDENRAMKLQVDAATIQQTLSDEIERNLAARVEDLEEKLRVMEAAGSPKRVGRSATRVRLSINTMTGRAQTLVDDEELTPKSGSILLAGRVR